MGAGVGDRFIAGAVLHTGASVFSLEDRIAAVSSVPSLLLDPAGAVWRAGADIEPTDSGEAAGGRHPSEAGGAPTGRRDGILQACGQP
jgi:hypothetical protein